MNNLIKVGNCFFPVVRQKIAQTYLMGDDTKTMSKQTGINESVFNQILKRELPRLGFGARKC